jgi:hypothetical protein
MTEFEFTEKDVAIAALLPEDEMLTVGRRWRPLAAATAVRLSGEVFEIGCGWSYIGVDHALAARIEDYFNAQRQSELIKDYLDGEVISVTECSGEHNAIHEGLDGELVAVMVK